MAAIGDIYEVRIFCDRVFSGQASVNVRHYRVTQVLGTGATNLTIAQFLDTAYHSKYKPLLCDSARYRGVGVRRIYPLPAETETLTGGNAGNGTATGQALPEQTCGIITLRTALGGPRYRGRVYVPFPSEDGNDADARPTTAYFDNLTLLGNTLVSGMSPGAGGNTIDMVAVVWSRKYNTYQDILTAQARFKWGTQRSRGTYGAKNLSPV